MNKIEALKKIIKSTKNKKKVDAWFEGNIKSKEEWHNILQAAINEKYEKILKIVIKGLDECKKIEVEDGRDRDQEAIKKEIVNESYEIVFSKAEAKAEGYAYSKWKEDNITYKGTLLAVAIRKWKLAEDVLKIAVMMKDKKADGVYDLDRLFKEENI